MITFHHKGDFSITTNFLNKSKNKINSIDFSKYGDQGVMALSAATPKDTGKTAKSWNYEVIKEPGKVTIRFSNTNSPDGIPVAVLIQYGHSTAYGAWIEGRDYINPAIQPIFDEIVKKAWGEVKSN